MLVIDNTGFGSEDPFFLLNNVIKLRVEGVIRYDLNFHYFYSMIIMASLCIILLLALIILIILFRRKKNELTNLIKIKRANSHFSGKDSFLPNSQDGESKHTLVSKSNKSVVDELAK